MKTKSYNPSSLELEFAQAIIDLSEDIQAKIKSNKIIEIENRSKEDNPILVFKLEDEDGDRHEVVVKFIQRMDD